jgi:hypothetical protein
MSDARLRELERRSAGDPATALQAERERLGRPLAGPPPWGYDLEHAFAYAQGFTLANVAETLYHRPGENDGPDWWCVVRLTDGRFAFLSAWCDYTGWG